MFKFHMMIASYFHINETSPVPRGECSAKFISVFFLLIIASKFYAESVLLM